MPFDLGNAWKAAWNTAGAAVVVTSPIPPLALVSGAVAGATAFVAGGYASKEGVDGYVNGIQSTLARGGDQYFDYYERGYHVSYNENILRKNLFLGCFGRLKTHAFIQKQAYTKLIQNSAYLSYCTYVNFLMILLILSTEI